MTEAYAITMPPAPAAGILAGPAAAAPSLAVGGQPHVQVPFSQPVLATQQRSPHALLMQQQQAEAAAAAMASGVNGGLAAPSAQAKSDTEDTDVEDEENGRNPSAYKCKPRRKATQKPVGSDQKRQAFSKRKRGIVLKAYQLYKLTDAKVFMFMVNDKGSSWAYASPSFGSSLRPDHLKHMRELADLPHTPKHITEVMAHPKLDESDRVADNRHMYLTSLSVQDNLHLVTGSVPASVPFLQPPPMAPIHGAPRASYGCPTQLPDGMLLHVGHPQMQPQHATLQQPHHLPAEHYMHHAQHPQAQHLYGQPQQAPQYMHMHLPHHQPQQHLFQPQPQPQLAQYGCPVPVPAPVPAPAPAPVPAPAPAPGGPPNAAGSAAAPNASGAEGAGSEHSQQPSSSFGQKAVQADKPASPSKGTDGADPKPQTQVGKTGSDEVAIITAGSANLGTFKPEDEAEATQAKRASGSGQAGKRLSSQQKSAEQQQPQQQPQQQQQQPYQQQPQQQAHQTQQQQQQSQQQPQHAQQLTSLYAGRVIADPSGNLYRVVNNDQLLPLLPHEVDQALAAAGLQSPGLATLAAAAAAAGGPGGTPTPAGAPPPSTLGMGAVPATAALGPGGQPPVHAHHLNTGGSLYGGAPEGPFGPPQPQYAQLLLPQQLGVGYSQPMFMDGAGGSQAMGGVGIYMSQPMGSSYPMHTQSQPLGLPPYPGNAIFYGGPPLLSSTPLQQGVPAP